MKNLESIKQILITLEVADKHVLFITLSKEGSINRKGNGSPDCNDNDLYIGVTKEPLFEKLVVYITDEMQKFFGRTFDVPEKKGRICELKIMVKGDHIETGVQFLYGEFSQGPPPPFRTLVVKAVELTDNWHRKQKKVTNMEANPNKPWWKFW